MRKLILFLGLLIAFLGNSFAQFTPSLRCLFVKDDNTVSLYFVPSSDSTNFLYYSVYWADNYTGPYTELATGLSTCNTDCFDGLDPAIHNYYFIRANYSGGVQYNSDTLAVMKTTLTNPGDGTALLTWAPDPFDPLQPTSDQYFTIYRKNPNDFDFMIAGVTSASNPRSFRDTINVCNDLVKYRVQIQNQLTSPTNRCRNSSTISQAVFQNSITPYIPLLKSVSVHDTTDRIILSWAPSNSTDVDSYVIFHSATPVTTWTPIDTVWGRLNTTWIDDINISTAVNNYRISARDSCGLASAMTIDYQSNMILTHSVDVCHLNVTLTWTPYVSMTSGLNHYEVMLSINGDPYNTVASNITATSTSYTHSGLVSGNNYRFVVKAVSNGNTYLALSNKQVFDFIVEETNDYVYVAGVSVKENKNIEVTINTSGDQVPFDFVTLYRAEDTPQNFVKINEIPYQGSAVLTYMDYNLQVTKKTYYYRASLHSDCLPEPIMSNTSNSILLLASGDAAHRNTLQWFNYDDNVPLTPNPESFIHRKMETDGDFVEIVSNIVWASYNTYVDDVSELQHYGSDFKYKVGVNQTTNEYGYCPSIFSNEVTLRQKPTIWIPNAFRPIGSQNKVFKPVTSFVSADTYKFVIYNRYGQTMFQTTNPNEGWEGRLSNGDFAPAGIYIYKIEFVDTSDELFTTNGTVTLFY